MYGTKNQHTQCLSGKESTCSAGDLQEIRVPSLGQEDPLEEETATHSSILARESHEQRSLAVHGVTKSWTQLRSHRVGHN